ncbi:mechanosensitive ion channel [Sabulilitoribacter multivorans]|uniref:Mechanosensitive ion channel n=1 Tax=Flaviramulus multivorans TaxID=1304750 RepID=A0ABS9IGC6_9FLAO|nr:mechanosensitive ion channel domain-containing protein [Flaviramulus multivorans]MCF7559433.1 mechanosensitive ion channel [Flaviramulus multivorans]
METIKKFLEFELITIGENTLQVYSIFAILIIFIITKALLWLIKRALYRKRISNKIDVKDSYALYQIIKYLIWVIAIGFILEALGVKVTLLLAGSAALLVGIGLGLQQTFNDIISGIILLSEKSIRVDDVLDIDGIVVKIQSIGLRTSKGINTDDISMIIPNSLITTNKVINWSHQSEKARFRVDVGVAYGSDVDKVIKILEESLLEHPDIYDKKLIEVRLTDFGASSLDFQVLFFSENIFSIGRVKSDIRKNIHKNLAKNNITIPFPQLDLHIKNTKSEIS